MGAPSQQPAELQNRLGWLEVGARAGKQGVMESVGLKKPSKIMESNP